MTAVDQDKFDISSDGVTVWVNDEFSLLGRFGKMGVDVHKSIAAQIAGEGECLCCTHGLTTREDWQLFVSKMDEHYGVKITDDLMPSRLLQ